MRLNDCLDVLIPRGGANLIKTVLRQQPLFLLLKQAQAIVIFTWKRPLTMATEIIVNAKCQRPSVCNAAEIVIHQEVAESFYQQLKKV